MKKPLLLLTKTSCLRGVECGMGTIGGISPRGRSHTTKSHITLPRPRPLGIGANRHIRGMAGLTIWGVTGIETKIGPCRMKCVAEVIASRTVCLSAANMV